MKSLLVDALRQANEGEASGTLSDSGSFDATRDDFGVIASDESPADERRLEGEESADGNLELLETDEAKRVDGQADTDLASNDAVEFAREAFAAPQSTNRIVTSASSTVVGSAPRLARYSPLLCLCLSLAAAGVWAIYLKLDTRHSAAALGAAFSESRQSVSEEESQPLSTAERFPFLSSADPSTAQEGSE